MFFSITENSSYEFLIEYILQNKLLPADYLVHAYNHALVKRAQEYGFKSIEEYCRYVLYLHYREFIEEIKLILLLYQPLYLYKQKNYLDSLSNKFITSLLEEPDKESEEKNSSQWLRRVLTAKIQLKSTPEKKVLRILGIESATGENEYSLGIRLYSILQDTYNIEINILESNKKLIQEGAKGIFHRGKVMKLSDNYRSLYFENISGDRFRINDNIKNIIKFKNYDVFTKKDKVEEYGKYHFLLASNLLFFYPRHIAHKIINKIIPFLAPNGLMLIDIPNDLKISPFKCLDIVNIGKTRVFKRNKNECSQHDFIEISFEDETLKNQILRCKHYFFDNKLDKAKKEIDKIIHKNIDNFEANYLKGDIYSKQKIYRKAINQYKRVLIIKPNFMPICYNLAAVLYFAKRNDEAREELEKLTNRLNENSFKELQNFLKVEFSCFNRMTKYIGFRIKKSIPTSVDELSSEVTSQRTNKMEIPSFDIPDLFQKRQKVKQEEEIKEQPTREMVVVNISELPSTRDYGEHDPWKKKLEKEKAQKEAEEKKKKELAKAKRKNLQKQKESLKKNEEKIINSSITPKTERVPPASEIQPKIQPVTKTPLKINDSSLRQSTSPTPSPFFTEIMRNDTRRRQEAQKALEEKRQKEIKSQKKKEIQKRKASRLNAPSNALFLDNVNVNELNLPKNIISRYTQGKSKSRKKTKETINNKIQGPETNENYQQDYIPKSMGTTKSSLNAPPYRKKNSKSQEPILPTIVLNGLLKSLEKKNFNKMLSIICAYSIQATGDERQLLDILKFLCEASIKKHGKCNEVYSLEVILRKLKLNESTTRLNIRNPKIDP